MQSLFTTCQAVQLSAFRLVCANGIIGAPALTAAGTSTIAKNAQIDSDVVRLPFYNRWRTADVPDGFHPFPQGWGLVSQRRSPSPPPQRSPQSSVKSALPWLATRLKRCRRAFYVTLASWAPCPQLLMFPMFLRAAVLAGCGFSLEPNSSLAPRRRSFGFGLLLCVVGISEALFAGNAVTEAFHEGQREVAIEKRQSAAASALREARRSCRAIPPARS